MGAVGIHVVVAIKKDRTQYWVAATRREKAAETVQRLLLPGWKTVLSDQQLSREQIATLNLRPYGICKLNKPDGPSAAGDKD